MSSTLPFTYDNVVLALGKLYHGASNFPGDHSEADKFLTKFQAADATETVIPVTTALLSQQLLASNVSNATPQSQSVNQDKYEDSGIFFAMLSLKKCISSPLLNISILRHVKTLNPPQTSSQYLTNLRAHVLQCMNPALAPTDKIQSGYRPTETQAALVLSMLAIKLSWTTVVNDMIQFVHGNQITPLFCMNFLGVMTTVVSEEMDVVHSPNFTNEDYRMTVQNFALTVLDARGVGGVFDAFVSVYSNDSGDEGGDTTRKQRVLSAFCSWVQGLNRFSNNSGNNNHTYNLLLAPNTPGNRLVSFAFDNICSIPQNPPNSSSDPKNLLNTTSVEVLCGLAFSVGSAIRNNLNDTNWAGPILGEIVDKLGAGFRSLITITTQDAFECDESEDEDDDDDDNDLVVDQQTLLKFSGRIKGLGFIFTEFALAYLPVLATPNTDNAGRNDTVPLPDGEQWRTPATSCAKLISVLLSLSALPSSFPFSAAAQKLGTIPLNFWWEFVARLDAFGETENTSGGDARETYYRRQEIIDFYGPPLVSLIGLLPSLQTYPLSIFKSSERTNPFPPKWLARFDFEIRPPIADTLTDCCRLVGGELVLTSLGKVLQARWHLLMGLHDKMNQQKQQQTILLALESTLSCIACVGHGQFIPVDDKTNIAQVAVDLSPKISQAFAKMSGENSENNIAAKSCNHLLSSATNYIVHNLADQLTGLILYVASTLKPAQGVSSTLSINTNEKKHKEIHNINSLTSQNASVVLKSLCFSLSCNLLSGIQHGRYEQPVTVIQACAENLLKAYTIYYDRQQKLPPFEEKELLAGLLSLQASLSFVAINVPQLQHLHEYANTLLSQIVTPAGSQLIGMSGNLAAYSLPDTIDCFDRLTVIIQNIGKNPPKATVKDDLRAGQSLLSFLRQIWQPMESLLATAGQTPININLSEAICRFIKHAIRNCTLNDQNRATFQNEFFNKTLAIIDAFFKNGLGRSGAGGSSSFLYLASIIFTDFGRVNTPQLNNDMSQLIMSLSTTFSQQFLNPSSFVTCEDPALIEEYFFMAERIVVHCGGLLVSNRDLLIGMLKLATVQGGIRCPSKGSTRAVVSFLHEVLRGSVASEMLSVCGQDIVSAIIAVSLNPSREGGGSPNPTLTNHKRSVSSLLHTVYSSNPRAMSRMVENALGGVLLNQRERFVSRDGIRIEEWIREEQEVSMAFHSVFGRAGIGLRDVERAVLQYWENVGRARAVR